MFTRCGRIAALLALLLAQEGCKPRQPNPGAVASGVAPAVPVPAAPKRDQPFAVGDVVWDFASLAQTGQRVRLHDFADKPVLVYFCPSNSVEACSALADTLTQRWLEVNPHLSMVFGVTQDDLITQREFGVLHEVPFLFLADTEGTLARGFGLAPGAVTSFLIDKDAHVRKVFTPPTANHPAEIVAALTELHLLAPAQPL